jgi:hypothetical protein
MFKRRSTELVPLSYETPAADDFRAIYSATERPVPRKDEDIAGQPPRIVRTIYTGHKGWTATDFAPWALTGMVIIGLVFIIALAIHEMNL